MSSTFVICSSLINSLLTTVTATGKSDTAASRLVAVTMTSSMTLPAAPSAAHDGVARTAPMAAVSAVTWNAGFCALVFFIDHAPQNSRWPGSPLHGRCFSSGEYTTPVLRM